MKQWSVGRKLYVGIGILLTLIVASGVLAVYSLSVIQGNMEQAAGPMSKRIALAADIVSDAQTAWAAEKGAIVNAFVRNRHDIDEYRAEEAEAQKNCLLRSPCCGRCC